MDPDFLRDCARIGYLPSGRFFRVLRDCRFQIRVNGGGPNGCRERRTLNHLEHLRVYAHQPEPNSAFAVPLLAAITLHATSLQMGLLRAAEFAPFLVFTLPAGVWADYGIRRSLMIAANLVRGFHHRCAAGCVPRLDALGSPLLRDVRDGFFEDYLRDGLSNLRPRNRPPGTFG